MPSNVWFIIYWVIRKAWGQESNLVLDVDEPLGSPDGRGEGPGDGVVDRAAFLRREGRLVFQLKPVEQNREQNTFNLWSWEVKKSQAFEV